MNTPNACLLISLKASLGSSIFKGESFRWHVYVASKILPCSGNVSMEIPFGRIFYLSVCTCTIRCKTWLRINTGINLSYYICWLFYHNRETTCYRVLCTYIDYYIQEPFLPVELKLWFQNPESAIASHLYWYPTILPWVASWKGIIWLIQTILTDPYKQVLPFLLYLLWSAKHRKAHFAVYFN